MSIATRICEAFCDGFRVEPVEIGFAIKSPFQWFTGDSLVFYARKKGDFLRFEDDGLTISELDAAGADITSGPRFETLQELLHEHGIIFDEGELLFHTDWIEEHKAGKYALAFLGFMTRVQDFLFTTRNKTASTFKDDLITALIDRFGEERVFLHEAPVPSLAYYVVDIVVRHASGKMAAIFPATSEAKGLEAVLFAKEIELKDVQNVIPFLIYEDASSPRVSKQTRSKAMNSELQMGDWGGGQVEVIDKVGKHVGQSFKRA